MAGRKRKAVAIRAVSTDPGKLVLPGEALTLDADTFDALEASGWVKAADRPARPEPVEGDGGAAADATGDDAGGGDGDGAA